MLQQKLFLPFFSSAFKLYKFRRIYWRFNLWLARNWSLSELLKSFWVILMGKWALGWSGLNDTRAFTGPLKFKLEPINTIKGASTYYVALWAEASQGFFPIAFFFVTAQRKSKKRLYGRRRCGGRISHFFPLLNFGCSLGTNYFSIIKLVFAKSVKIELNHRLSSQNSVESFRQRSVDSAKVMRTVNSLNFR